MRQTLRVFMTAMLIATTGCASWRNPGGFVTADSSANSSGQNSASSDNSSGTSQQSSDSSQSSNNSSGEGGSSDVAASTGRSSDNSSNATSRNSGQASAVVSGVGLLLTTTVGIGFAIYGTVMAVKPKPAEPLVALRYLRANEDQLRQDLALGMGPTLDDLASAAEISADNAERFRLLLHRNRRELLGLADGEQLTAARAVRFLSRIGELVFADEALRADGESFRERHTG